MQHPSPLCCARHGALSNWVLTAGHPILLLIILPECEFFLHLSCQLFIEAEPVSFSLKVPHAWGLGAGAPSILVMVGHLKETFLSEEEYYSQKAPSSINPATSSPEKPAAAVPAPTSQGGPDGRFPEHSHYAPGPASAALSSPISHGL